MRIFCPLINKYIPVSKSLVKGMLKYYFYNLFVVTGQGDTYAPDDALCLLVI